MDKHTVYTEAGYDQVEVPFDNQVQISFSLVPGCRSSWLVGAIWSYNCAFSFINFYSNSHGSLLVSGVMK